MGLENQGSHAGGRIPWGEGVIHIYDGGTAVASFWFLEPHISMWCWADLYLRGKRETTNVFAEALKQNNTKCMFVSFKVIEKRKFPRNVRPMQKCWESTELRHWPMALCVSVVQIHFDKWRFSHEESHRILHKATLVSNTCFPFSVKNKFFKSDKVKILQSLRKDNEWMCLTPARCSNWQFKIRHPWGVQVFPQCGQGLRSRLREKGPLRLWQGVLAAKVYLLVSLLLPCCYINIMNCSQVHQMRFRWSLGASLPK